MAPALCRTIIPMPSLIIAAREVYRSTQSVLVAHGGEVAQRESDGGGGRRLTAATTRRAGWAVSVAARVPCWASEVKSRIPAIAASTAVGSTVQQREWCARKNSNPRPSESRRFAVAVLNDCLHDIASVARCPVSAGGSRVSVVMVPRLSR